MMRRGNLENAARRGQRLDGPSVRKLVERKEGETVVASGKARRRSPEEVIAYFSQDHYAVETTGIELLEVGDGYAKTRLVIDDRHKNAAGHVMGGVYFTMADITFSVAVNQYEEKLQVALNAQIQFISSVSDGVIYGEARVQKEGRRIAFAYTEIRDDEGRLLAVVSSGSYAVTGAE